MATNIDSFKHILDWIDALVKDPKNGAFLEEFTKRYNYYLPKIDDVYELCVEKIIKEQSERFYEKFPICYIREQLVSDFVKMEHWKRKDNFEEYCFAINQQVESIVNGVLHEHNILYKKVYESLNNSSFDSDAKVSKEIKNGDNYKVSKVLFFEDADNCRENLKKIIDGSCVYNTLTAKNKLSIVLYIVGFAGSFSNFTDKMKFDYLKNRLFDIYRIRNLNHRDITGGDKDNDKVKKIITYRYVLFLEYAGVLADFVGRISAGYTSIDRLTES